MPLRIATLEELGTVLSTAILKTQEERPLIGAIFGLLQATGLRIREVLETNRWGIYTEELFQVQLEKGEEFRYFQISDIPEELISYFKNQTPFIMETYSAVNNAFKYYTPNIIFGESKRRTTLHSFRYYIIQKLFAEGADAEKIAAFMGHLDQKSTLAYMHAKIRIDLPPNPDEEGPGVVI